MDFGDPKRPFSRSLPIPIYDVRVRGGRLQPNNTWWGAVSSDKDEAVAGAVQRETVIFKENSEGQDFLKSSGKVS